MTGVQKIRVLLVDDHEVLRDTLAARINAEPDMLVVGQAGDAEAGVREAKTGRPDIVLMDIDMPGSCPFAAASTIGSRLPETRIIFLSAYSHDMYIQQAIAVKAWGYVTKKESYATICQAIREASAGSVFFSDDIQARVVSGPEGLELAPGTKARATLLTQREVEVLRHLARGLSTKEIASAMHISVKTVNSHKTHLMCKLGHHDRVELARYAFREGIATP